jgi:hypothetical protein
VAGGRGTGKWGRKASARGTPPTARLQLQCSGRSRADGGQRGQAVTRQTVNLESLDMRGCSSVSDLAPLGSLVALTLRLFHSDFSLADLPTLQLRVDRGER